MSYRRAAVVVGAVLVGLLGVALAFLAASSWVSPQATRPCEESYAQWPAEDPIFSVPLSGVAEPVAAALGSCEDSDSGGVSSALGERLADATPESIIDAYTRAARSQGWQGVRSTSADDPDGVGLCAHRIQDGHTHDLHVTIDERPVPRSRGATVRIEVFGDAGDYPSC